MPSNTRLNVNFRLLHIFRVLAREIAGESKRYRHTRILRQKQRFGSARIYAEKSAAKRRAEKSVVAKVLQKKKR